MSHYGFLRWYIKLSQRLTASFYPEVVLQARLWPDEVHFGLVASITSYHHIVSNSYINVNVWHNMAGYIGIELKYHSKSFISTT